MQENAGGRMVMKISLTIFVKSIQNDDLKNVNFTD